nr:hypothetical protein [Tanacetum cinerariifolium]
MLVQPQSPAAEEDDEVKVPSAPTPPSPIIEPTSPPQEPTNTPKQAQPALSSPPQAQPQPDTSKSSMSILNTLMETYVTLSQKVAHLEQDKVAHALEIIKLKKRVKKLDKSMHLNKGRIEAIDADEEITLEASAAEQTVFDDEEVTMTMAQTLIKMKAKKARILNEQLAKRLHDEEVEQAAAREKQEKGDFKKLKCYKSTQSRKNVIVYLKNMVGYKMEHFKCMTYDKVRPIFKKAYNKVQTFLKPDRDEEPTKKRVVEETKLQESFKELKAVEVSGSHSTQDTPTNDPQEMSEEDVKNMLEIVLVFEFKVEALQVNYPLIDWEIHS